MMIWKGKKLDYAYKMIEALLECASRREAKEFYREYCTQYADQLEPGEVKSNIRFGLSYFARDYSDDAKAKRILEWLFAKPKKVARTRA